MGLLEEKHNQKEPGRRERKMQYVVEIFDMKIRGKRQTQPRPLTYRLACIELDDMNLTD